jgi:hypothetical protein
VATDAEILRERIEAYVKAVDVTIAETQAKIAEYGWTYALEWGWCGDIVQKETLAAMARGILAAVDNGRADIYEACANAREKAEQQIMFHVQRGTSRSTSGWANIVEETKAAAYAKIIGDVFNNWVNNLDQKPATVEA